MSTLDVTMRQRAIVRPKKYLDYTSLKSRVRIASHSSAHSISPQKTIRRHASIDASTTTSKTDRHYDKTHHFRADNTHAITNAVASKAFSEVALNAISMANPSCNKNDAYQDIVYVRVDRKPRLVLNKIIYGFGVLVLLASFAATINTFIVNHQAKEQVAVLGEQSYTTDANGVQEGTGSDPAESPVSNEALMSYFPNNPEDPRYIRIPSLGVISRVKTLGLNATTRAVDSPRNIYDAGWYDGSVRPGSGSGTSLLLGHVSGWTSPGVFKKIEKLNQHDQIIIENGEGRTFTYQVYKTEVVHLSDIDMNKVLATEKAGEHDIKLMTCSGNFDYETEKYDSRTIVYARQTK